MIIIMHMNHKTKSALTAATTALVIILVLSTIGGWLSYFHESHWIEKIILAIGLVWLFGQLFFVALGASDKETPWKDNNNLWG